MLVETEFSVITGNKSSECKAQRFGELQVYNHVMAKDVIHISEAEVASKFASLMARVRAGAEVVIENDARPVAVLHPAEPVRRTISECIAVLPEDSTATIDPDFAKDVEAAIESHREPLNPPAWD
jgi:antitoxin (DNA-binding transcriptional repressor) of toxin-antitoxin stability system